MAGNKSLGKAKNAKQDEFYTQLSDIEKELRHYRKHFKGKTVFCNCDDPFESNFFKYFVLNFNRLGLKKLICTCYTNSPIANTQLSFFDVVENASENKPYKAVVTTVYDKTGDGGVDMFDIAELFKSGENTLTELQGNGDFRSEECIELLKESDIVVTNPPFSLFRNYVKQLVEYKKIFLIIGTQNNLTYKDIFSLIKNNRLWLGYKSGDMAFTVPEYYEPRETRYWQDESGQKWRSFGNMCWYTNLDIKKRHEEMILVKRYNPELYPKYDNYDVINVNKTADIPSDYYPCWFYCDKSNECDWAKEKGLNKSAVALCEYNHISFLDNASPNTVTVFNDNKYLTKKCNGIMGVPITFMDKYNPQQFEIIGIANSARYIGDFECYTLINGKKIYNRILIRFVNPEE